MPLKSYIDWRVIQEMAKAGLGPDIGTKTSHSIEHDTDDWGVEDLGQTSGFAHQFNIKDVPNAQHQRTIMLYRAIEKLQNLRDQIAGRSWKAGEVAEDRPLKGGLADKIRTYLKTGDESALLGEFAQGQPPLSEKEIQSIKDTYTFKSKDPSKQGRVAIPMKIGDRAWWDDNQKITEKEIAEFADTDAFEIAKSRTANPKDWIDDFKDDTKMEFKFKRQRAGESVVIARPYLNRLYHKWETTKDEPHHPGSGMSTKGKFSIDLSHPAEFEGKMTTRGFEFPEKVTWERSLKGLPSSSTRDPKSTKKDQVESEEESRTSKKGFRQGYRAGFLAHAAYNHYGDLTNLKSYETARDEGEGVRWLPMNGENGTAKIQDPMIDWLIDKMYYIVLREERDAAVKSGKKFEPTPKKIKEEAKARIAIRVCTKGVYAHPIPELDLVPEKYKKMAENRKFELDDVSQSLCDSGLDEDKINQIKENIKKGKAYIKTQYVFLPFTSTDQESLENLKNLKLILPESHSLKIPSLPEEEEEDEGDEEDIDGLEDGETKKGKKVLAPFSPEKQEEILANAHNFTPTTLGIKEKPEDEEHAGSLRTRRRTDIYSAGVTPSREGIDFLDTRLPKNLEKREMLQRFVTPSAEEDEISWKSGERARPAGPWGEEIYGKSKRKEETIPALNWDFVQGIKRVIGPGSIMSAGLSPTTKKALLLNAFMDIYNSVVQSIYLQADSPLLNTSAGRQRLAQAAATSILQKDTTSVGAESLLPRRQRKFGDLRQHLASRVAAGETGEAQKAPIRSRQSALDYLRAQKDAQETADREGTISSAKVLGQTIDDFERAVIDYLTGEKPLDKPVEKGGVRLPIDRTVSEKEAREILNKWKKAGQSSEQIFKNVQAGNFKVITTTDLVSLLKSKYPTSTDKIIKSTVKLWKDTNPELNNEDLYQKIQDNDPNFRIIDSGQFRRAKMSGTPGGLASRLKKPMAQEPTVQSPTTQTPPDKPISGEPEPEQVDWSKLSGLTLSEKIDYFKNKLKN